MAKHVKEDFEDIEFDDVELDEEAAYVEDGAIEDDFDQVAEDVEYADDFDEDAADGDAADEAPTVFDDVRGDDAWDYAVETVAEQEAPANAPAPVSPAARKSKRTRITLIVVIVLLIAMIAGLGVLVYNLLQESQSLAVQQASSQQSEKDKEDLRSETTTDTGSQAVKRTTIPNLMSLIGLTQAQAVEQLQHGATITATREVNEKGNPVKTNLTVTLTEEPADSRTGTPTVYLMLDKDGYIIKTGYSAGTATLGFGTLSFEDMVKNGQIVEKTFAEAGLNIPAGAVQLPASRSDYTTYASDGKTVTRESCSFQGAMDVAGYPYEWDAVLLYDYAAANATGNLANTLRQVYIYLGLVVPAEDVDSEEDAAE